MPVELGDDHEIATILREQAWAESAALLQSIHSIGPLTTAWLLVSTLDFQVCHTDGSGGVCRASTDAPWVRK